MGPYLALSCSQCDQGHLGGQGHHLVHYQRQVGRLGCNYILIIRPCHRCLSSCYDITTFAFQYSISSCGPCLSVSSLSCSPSCSRSVMFFIQLLTFVSNLSCPSSVARTAMESSRFLIVLASAGYSDMRGPCPHTCSATRSELAGKLSFKLRMQL